jgi:hypothetical protein
MPPSAGSLTPAAQGGPIVLLNVSDIRSDALLLTPEGVRVVRLPELTPSGVKIQVGDLLGALQNAQDPTSDQDLRDGADERLLSVPAGCETLLQARCWMHWASPNRLRPANRGLDCGSARPVCCRFCHYTRPGTTPTTRVGRR